MMLAYKRIFTMLAVALLGACSAGTQLDRSSTAVKVADVLPPPDATVAPIEVAPSRVLPGDELTVSVFGASDLNQTGIVDSAGNIALPLAGSLPVAGKTPEQVAADIEAKLRGGYLKNPHVSVNLKSAGVGQTVTVDGEVQQPGMYPVVSHMTLQQAIATAKGASDTANIKHVVVFRTVNNQKMAAMFDLHAIRSGAAADPQVFGNDVIVVGESSIQKFLRNTMTAFPLLGRFIPLL